MSIFRKPSTKKIGLKLLCTGMTGTGKTLFALSFPKIMALDSEAGMALYEGKEHGKNLLGVANTQSVTEMEEALEEIKDSLEDDENSIGSLVIDSETKFYQNLQQVCLEVEEKRARRAGRDVMDTNLSVRSWGKIKTISQKLQNFKIDLSSKGCHIISVSQVEDVKQKVGENFVKVGEKPSMSKNSEYDYDIIIDLTKEETKDGIVYKGVIKKDRTGVTKVGQIIENPSYAIWADYVGDRSGAEKLDSKLSGDMDKDMKALEKEEDEKSKTVVDDLKELMQNETLKTKALAMIKQAGITTLSNPSAADMVKIEKIIEQLKA